MRDFFAQYKQSIYISAFHAVLMMYAMMYVMSSHKTYADEKALMSKLNKYRSKMPFYEDNVKKSDFVCIDVNNFWDLNAKPGSYTGEKQIVTDRKKLGELMQLIQSSGADPKLILFDIIFDTPTNQDSFFLMQSTPLKEKILSIQHWNNKSNRLDTCLFPFKTAVASYFVIDKGFYKYPLFFRDTLPSIPMEMDRRLNGRSYKKWSGDMYTCNGNWCWGNPVIDYKILPKDAQKATKLDTNPNVMQNFTLGEILLYSMALTPEQKKAVFNDKIIVIGDFSGNDMHQTPVGTMAGPLVLINSYLTLKHNQHFFRWDWAFYLWLGFFILSFRIFSKIHFVKGKWLHETKIGQWFLKYLNFPGYVSFLSIVSYITFHIPVSILFLGVYLHFLHEFSLAVEEGTWMDFLKAEFKKVATSKVKEKVKL